MIEHGDLELLPQAEVPYERTALGLFDTMQRSFICHSEDAFRYMMKVFQPGRSDAETLRVADPSERGWKNMLISSLAPEQGPGRQMLIRVNYEGLLYAKAAAIKHNCQSEQRSASPIGSVKRRAVWEKAPKVWDFDVLVKASTRPRQGRNLGLVRPLPESAASTASRVRAAKERDPSV